MLQDTHGDALHSCGRSLISSLQIWLQPTTHCHRKSILLSKYYPWYSLIVKTFAVKS